MAATYNIQDNISYILVDFKLDKIVNIIFWVMIIGAVVQAVFLWIVLGGGEAALGIRISDQPMQVVDYWLYLLVGLILVDVVSLYFVGWSMLADRKFELSRNGIKYISSLWGQIKVKEYDFIEIEDIFVKDDTNKGNTTYQVGIKINSKDFSISPTLEQENTKELVQYLNAYRTKNRV